MFTYPRITQFNESIIRVAISVDLIFETASNFKVITTITLTLFSIEISCLAAWFQRWSNFSIIFLLFIGCIYIYFLSLIKHRIITTITIFLFSYRKMLKRLLIISRHDTRWSLESYGEENCRGHYRKLICFATHPRAIRLYPLTRSFTDVYYRSKFVDSLTYFMEFVLHT